MSNTARTTGSGTAGPAGRLRRGPAVAGLAALLVAAAGVATGSATADPGAPATAGQHATDKPRREDNRHGRHHLLHGHHRPGRSAAGSGAWNHSGPAAG
ncbi:hypothetical protein ACFRAR_07675 [Kitasatospora sp. NPDC056651]|uniref:hypothetical protein n=1 Tax=Kitasatospora sp. NPDC056651 TaxID=3345892 RepID=UPI0036A18836